VTAPTDLIKRIHSSGRPVVIAVTGGGSGAIAGLLQVPGASAIVLEAIVPYAATALADWLGGAPDHYCSERTARAMAMAAFERARTLSDADPHTLLGIGATASLASTRPKRGPHRIHVAWQSATTTAVASWQFASESTRAEEEALAAQLILEAIADACGVGQATESVSIVDCKRREQHAPVEWTDLLLGRRQLVSKPEETPILFPGSFNPLHAAHTRMAEVAEERFGGRIIFELSIANVDKPPLDFIEIADRLEQFKERRVLLTRAATFVEKAMIAPGCVFIVGVDTLVRIGDPTYYGDDPTKRDAAIAAIAQSGCRFLVFGRVANGGFQTLSDVFVPKALRGLCDKVLESDFRDDISSTALRHA
jgi:nicotinamide mononucleotide (NMN) deamidase PncC